MNIAVGVDVNEKRMRPSALQIHLFQASQVCNLETIGTPLLESKLMFLVRKSWVNHDAAIKTLNSLIGQGEVQKGMRS